MEGTNCNSKMGLKKGPWTKEEDKKLLGYIERHGHGSWRTLPAKAGLQRCGKSCRLRWTNYLRPDIKRGKFSTHEEKAIIRLHALLGNRWSVIAAHLPKRTDNEIKNYWNTRLKKRLTRLGIDPATHKPRNNPAGSALSAALSHMAQWEAARLEAEARLTRDSKLPLIPRLTSPPPLAYLAAPPCLDVLKVWQSSSIPSCFFSSLDSPTSTLNFSSSSLTAPTASSSKNEHAACGVDSYGQAQVDEKEYSYQYHMRDENDDVVFTGSMDLASLDQDYSIGDPLVGELDESTNYWTYLLSLVSSESPAFYG